MSLFCREDLERRLEGILHAARESVSEVSKEQFLISSDGELVNHICSRYEIELIELRCEDAEMNEFETKIDVSDDPSRSAASFRSGPLWIPATRIEIHIPFSGEEWIFHCRPNEFFTAAPNATIHNHCVRISISLPHDVEKKQFKSQYETELNLVKGYVESVNNQLKSFNNRLVEVTRESITSRRNRLKKHDGIAALLNIPLSRKKNAPSIARRKVKLRQVSPLPKGPKTGLALGWKVATDDYEYILRLIRHQGRSFEKTPSTFAKHNEEELRNIILAQLNGYFEGSATGETFRKRGKTDICIEQDDRAAFVAECKIWRGQARLVDALSQLLSYLTWRDSKASLILFNLNNKDFTRIVSNLPPVIQGHPQFVRRMRCQEHGEERIELCSKEDAGRRVTVHIFIFDLYQSP